MIKREKIYPKNSLIFGIQLILQRLGFYKKIPRKKAGNTNGGKTSTFTFKTASCSQLSNETTMFEAKIQQAVLLKRILDSLKDLVLQANLDCSPTGIALQALDQSHVSLVALLLRQEGFESYRCDRSIPLGINIASMTKILKCAGNDDSVTIQAEDDGDSVTFVFESTRKWI